MEWHIARHGETRDNLHNKWSGQQDGILTRQGQDHAVHLGDYIKRIHPDHITHSTLSRAANTVEIAKAHVVYNGEVTPDDGLKEVGFGQFEGKTLEETIEITRDSSVRYIGRTDLLLASTRGIFVERFGVEDSDSIIARRDGVIKSVKALAANQGIEKLLSVSHSVIGAYIIEYLLHGTFGINLTLTSDGKFRPQYYAEVCVLHFDDKGSMDKEKIEFNLMYESPI